MQENEKNEKNAKSTQYELADWDDIWKVSEILEGLLGMGAGGGNLNFN